MGWESSGVVGFDLGPLVQGQMRTAKLKMLITRLLLVIQVLVHCLYGGYNLHRFSDALGLVKFAISFGFIYVKSEHLQLHTACQMVCVKIS